MISELTTGQRQAALLFLAVFAIGGLFLAAFGRADPIAGHGWLVLVFALLSLFGVLTRYYDPEPAADSAADWRYFWRLRNSHGRHGAFIMAHGQFKPTCRFTCAVSLYG